MTVIAKSQYKQSQNICGLLLKTDR